MGISWGEDSPATRVTMLPLQQHSPWIAPHLEGWHNWCQVTWLSPPCSPQLLSQVSFHPKHLKPMDSGTFFLKAMRQEPLCQYQCSKFNIQHYHYDSKWLTCNMFFLVSTLERNSIRCLFAKLRERIRFELGRRRNAICAIEFMLALQETAKKGLYENGGNP